MIRSRRLFLRSLLIQALWNPRDFQGSGLAWALGEKPGVYNGHPYLSGVALGALTRLRSMEGGENGGSLDTRFREALRAPLGALGDALVWVGLRPLLLLAAVLFLLLGARPAVVLSALFLGYNGVHLALRSWGVRIGLTHGLGVAHALGSGGLHQWASRLQRGSVLFAGGVMGVLITGFALDAGALSAFQGSNWVALSVLPALGGLALLLAGDGRWLGSPRFRKHLRFLPLAWVLLILWGLTLLSLFQPSGA